RLKKLQVSPCTTPPSARPAMGDSMPSPVNMDSTRSANAASALMGHKNGTVTVSARVSPLTQRLSLDDEFGRIMAVLHTLG
ncbi:MAG: hypothetical protein F6K30_16525, partial [Cyanothece sp. SIO2G6]|nr:hypothetical protein [Cyanothece sp. SIO2G6]